MQRAAGIDGCRAAVGQTGSTLRQQAPFPVVDVNDLWLQQCAFQREEVIGKTMRLIQGPQTEGEEVGRLMDTIYLAPPSAAM